MMSALACPARSEARPRMMCYAGDTSCASDANIIHATSRKHYENQLASFRRLRDAVRACSKQRLWQSSSSTGRVELGVQKGWAACRIDRSNREGGWIAQCQWGQGRGGCTTQHSKALCLFISFFLATPQHPKEQQQNHHQLWQPNGWAMTTNGCSACCLCTTNKVVGVASTLLLLLFRLLLLLLLAPLLLSCINRVSDFSLHNLTNLTKESFNFCFATCFN